MTSTRLFTVRLLAALAAGGLFACGGASKVPPPLPQIDLPAGSDLKPWNAAGANNAWPQASTKLGGQVWLALGNLDMQTFAPAGPGLLVGLVPSTGAKTVVELGGSDGHQCENPGSVKADSGLLYASCSGNPYGVSTEGRGLVEVNPAGAGSVKRFAAVPAGFVPGPIAVAGSKIWIGDLSGGRVLGIDRGSFAAVDGAANPTPGIDLGCTAKNSYVSSMLALGGDLFLLCSAADGYLVRLDAKSGAAKGEKVLVGASPIALAQAGDGRLAVVNSTSATLTLVTVSASSLAVAKDVLKFQSSADLEDVKALDQFLFIVSADTKTLIKVDLTGATPKVVDEVNLNPANTPGADPTRAEVLDDNSAIVADSGLGRVVGVQFSSAKKAQ